MASESRRIQVNKFQAPKGTRDFYPHDMAVRRYIESVWRKVSINHGFDEVEAPMFEHLDLYTHKSGPGIVSEIFQVFSGKDSAEVAQIRSGQSAPYALRPEFTPTLARMVASEAASLPRPIKWFAIPQHFRAESPQRGRLREFGQWNVDFIGEESPRIDAELLACCIDALRCFGLSSHDIRIRYSDRLVVQAMLESVGISHDATDDWMSWLDKYDRLDTPARFHEARAFGGTEEQVKQVELLFSGLDPVVQEATAQKARALGREDIVTSAAEYGERVVSERLRPSQRRMFEFQEWLESMGLAEWCEIDFKIVRGIAYYTGLVFEVHEATGAERAIAGGGRYDKLIESFGGPSLPACGFGMGDVVLGNILRDKGLLKDEIIYEPIRPDAFVISNGDEIAEAQLPQLVASLRRDGFHVRHSYKSTRNVGKLLGDAGKARARFAVILGKELNDQPPRIALKNLDSGDQREIAVGDLPAALMRND